MYEADTIVAQATPPGKGAVAIIRLSGPQAFAIGRRLWHPLKSGGASPKPRRMLLGEIRDPDSGRPLDRALAVFMPGPRSLTGEDVLELHCHGGPYLLRTVVGLALAAGARMAEPGEFSRRAFLNGRIDLAQAEAIADLVEARGPGALAAAMGQLNRALSARIDSLREELIRLRAHLEAEIDFSDEDIALPPRREIASTLEDVRRAAGALHDSFQRGRIIREGVRAAIVGKPNAGKSSLFNLLLGSERAIVASVPGTTRDTLEESLQLGPWTLSLTDTAGMREARDEVEQLGVARTRSRAADAHLLIAVFDTSRPFEREDAEVLDLCRARHAVAVLNKIDLPQRLAWDELRRFGLRMEPVRLSALTAEGVGALRDALARAAREIAEGGTSTQDNVVIAHQRHQAALARTVEALGRARESVVSGMPPEIIAVDVTAATDALGEITGAVTNEDILDVIFREFCIGK